jgi:hypothetical protein
MRVEMNVNIGYIAREDFGGDNDIEFIRGSASQIPDVDIPEAPHGIKRGSSKSIFTDLVIEGNFSLFCCHTDDLDRAWKDTEAFLVADWKKRDVTIPVMERIDKNYKKMISIETKSRGFGLERKMIGHDSLPNTYSEPWEVAITR